MLILVKNLVSNGIPFIRVNKNGEFWIGDYFKMNNGEHFNPIGRQQQCFFIVKGKLRIGNNSGMSSTAIICHNAISIGDNVKIGGNTVIYDTDFHSLDAEERRRFIENKKKIMTKPIIICNNVFVGAHSTILKGVVIGENSIIGACSVVTKSIPSNEVWGGNPAKFIRSL